MVAPDAEIADDRNMQHAVQSIGIAVVEHHGRYLIGIRGSDQVLAGHAEFPGGKCQAGESSADCAVRECREETGLDIVADRLLERVLFRYPHGDVELFFWICRPVNPDAVADDQLSFRWVPRSELATLNFPEANRSVIQRLLRTQP